MAVLLVVIPASIVQCIGATVKIPQLINYQGKLTKWDGTPVEPKPYDLQFKLFTVASAGNAVWTEEIGNVPVVNGQFNVILGETSSSLSNVIQAATTDLYLEIAIKNEGGDYDSIDTRQQFLSTPFAIQAQNSINTTNHPYEVPVGGIIMWYGDPNSLPDGFELCDGNDGTPDLQDKFVKGVKASGESKGEEGGNHMIPYHEHVIKNQGGAPNKNYGLGLHPGNSNARLYWGEDTNPVMDFVERPRTYTDGVKSGSAAVYSNAPKYKSLYFIMRVK